MAFLSHFIAESDLKRGDHVYSLRYIGFYQHHGIVISRDDAYGIVPESKTDGPFMVIEQNRTGLRVVTLEEFKLGHNLRLAQYNVGLLEHSIKRSGTCYTEKKVSSDDIVENAINIFMTPELKRMWSVYSICTHNCEHFAFLCSTATHRLSEQILAAWDLTSSSLSIAMRTIISIADAAMKGCNTSSR